MIAFQHAACFAATVLTHEKWPIRVSLRPLDIYIYAFGSQSYATRLIFAGSAPLSAAKQAAHGILGRWANGTCVRLSLRGKARLLPCAASTVRCAILRRRNTCAVSPTFLYGAFFFVASALAAFLSARLTAYGNNAQTCILQRFRGVCPRRLYNHMPFSAICLMPNLPLDHNSATMTNLGKHGKEVFD